MGIYDIFKTRDADHPDIFQYEELPTEFRNQVIWIWKESIFNATTSNPYDRRSRQSNELMCQVHKAVCTELGRMELMNHQVGPEEDLLIAFERSDDIGLVLSIIEGMFRVILRVNWRYYGVNAEGRKFVNELNVRFRQNGIGYEFDVSANRIIKVEDQFIHQNATKKTLELLSDKRFRSANDEFLQAYDEYKASEFRECLTHCCSSMESTLKTICTIKGWPFNERDTASPLLKTYIQNSDLPTFFEQPLMLIATLRNRLSSSHGAGPAGKDVPEHFAKYALNASASAILLLIESAEL